MIIIITSSTVTKNAVKFARVKGLLGSRDGYGNATQLKSNYYSVNYLAIIPSCSTR